MNKIKIIMALAIIGATSELVITSDKTMISSSAMTLDPASALNEFIQKYEIKGSHTFGNIIDGMKTVVDWDKSISESDETQRLDDISAVTILYFQYPKLFVAEVEGSGGEISPAHQTLYNEIVEAISSYYKSDAIARLKSAKLVDFEMLFNGLLSVRENIINGQSRLSLRYINRLINELISWRKDAPINFASPVREDEFDMAIAPSEQEVAQQQAVEANNTYATAATQAVTQAAANAWNWLYGTSNK